MELGITKTHNWEINILFNKKEDIGTVYGKRIKIDFYFRLNI